MKNKLVLSSRLDSLTIIYRWIEHLLINKVNEKELRNILLITQEMVTNSILHGNQSVIEKNVIVEVFIKQKNITVEIEDEGEGIKRLPSKEEAKELDYLTENGRGLKLAVLMTKSIELHGNRIKLIFNRNNEG